MFNKLKAFTLAEVLIVITIIGVVATLVLPNLSNDVYDKQIVASLRKVYPELDIAYNNVIREHGKPVEWNVANNTNEATMSQQMYDYIIEQLPIKKACGTSTGCFEAYDGVAPYRTMILKDGTLLAIAVESMSSARSKAVGHSGLDENDIACKGYMGKFIVDVDGKDGNSELNNDAFQFFMCYDNGLVPEGDGPNGPAANATNGYTAWVLKAGNLDYLKCNDLDWNTKRSCK